MANHRLKIDFDASAIDLHLSEATQIAVQTLASKLESLEVSLRLQALEQFRDRISRMLPEAAPHIQTQEPPTDCLDQRAGHLSAKEFAVMRCSVRKGQPCGALFFTT
jgi:hypothetical protein